MELREWLFLVGAIIVLVVVIDAIRRARLANKDSVEISRSMGSPDLTASPLDDDFNPELPGNGFRIVQRPDEEFNETVTAESAFSASAQELNDSGLDTSESLPDAADEIEPASEADKPAYRVVSGERNTGLKVSKGAAAKDDFKERFLKRIGSKEAITGDKPEPKAEPAVEKAVTSSPAPQQQELIVLNVLSPDGEGFEGAKLRSLVEACGLELGKMQIFHRHEHGYQQGPIQFSMANAVEPGVFLPGFEDGSIPGVCFFLQLPGPEDAMMAFDYMLETAQCMVRNLGGELRDEAQSVMNGQTIEHCRQRVREFERRRLTERV